MDTLSEYTDDLPEKSKENEHDCDAELTDLNDKTEAMYEGAGTKESYPLGITYERTFQKDKKDTYTRECYTVAYASGLAKMYTGDLQYHVAELIIQKEIQERKEHKKLPDYFEKSVSEPWPGAFTNDAKVLETIRGEGNERYHNNLILLEKNTNQNNDAHELPYVTQGSSVTFFVSRHRKNDAKDAYKYYQEPLQESRIPTGSLGFSDLIKHRYKLTSYRNKEKITHSSANTLKLPDTTSLSDGFYRALHTFKDNPAQLQQFFEENAVDDPLYLSYAVYVAVDDRGTYDALLTMVIQYAADRGQLHQLYVCFSSHQNMFDRLSDDIGTSDDAFAGVFFKACFEDNEMKQELSTRLLQLKENNALATLLMVSDTYMSGVNKCISLGVRYDSKTKTRKKLIKKQ